MDHLKNKDSILKARADLLAQRPEQKSDEAKDLHLVEFILSNEYYALEYHYIKEVHPLKEVSYIPGVPNFVLGLINIRRKIISVIDLRELFGLVITKTCPNPKVIVLQDGEVEFGILAEEIIGLQHVSAKDMQESLPTLTGIHQEFIKGITLSRLLILDAEKLLHSSTIKVAQNV